MPRKTSEQRTVSGAEAATSARKTAAHIVDELQGRNVTPVRHKDPVRAVDAAIDAMEKADKADDQDKKRTVSTAGLTPRRAKRLEESQNELRGRGR